MKKAKKANGTRPDLIFALRDSGVILRNLPNDLTVREAERISGMLRTLVVPITPKRRKKEQCEGGCNGPVVAHDADGVPLCKECADVLRRAGVKKMPKPTKAWARYYDGGVRLGYTILVGDNTGTPYQPAIYMRRKCAAESAHATVHPVLIVPITKPRKARKSK